MRRRGHYGPSTPRCPTPQAADALLAPTRLFALVVLAATSAAPALAHSGPGADSTDAISWARRVVALRQDVAAAERAAAERRTDAPVLAERAFIGARELAEIPGMLSDESFRGLFLDAQAAYEHFHGAVGGIALSGREVNSLRDDAIDALAAGGGMPSPHAAAEARPASPPAAEVGDADVSTTLAYPAAAASAVSAQAGRLRRMLGDLSGLERRGRGYFRMIDRELERRGLPRELRYVPVIESGLNPHAVSSAGAAGLWQLMPATGAQFGLDAAGRHDPARSTVAAVRLLERLGAMFDGDWQLALAAYNWGPARVQSLIARERRRLGRTPTYWDVARHMPAETRAYVPRFIAVAEAMGG
jgi:hypothetical protein